MYQRIKASRQNENEKGFTLIELLIVVVILGILAAVVIFASAGFRDKGIKESCRTNLSSVRTAVEAFHADSPDALFPDNIADLTAGANKYLELSGVGSSFSGTPEIAILTGKGWTLTMTLGATSGALNGSTTVPQYASSLPAGQCG